jgi:hypothetical protein
VGLLFIIKENNRTLLPFLPPIFHLFAVYPFRSKVPLKPHGTRRRTGGDVEGKLANGVGSQYSHTTLERGVSSNTTADARTSAASSRLH